MAMTCHNGAQECNGCMKCQKAHKQPVCPVCGEEANRYYLDNGVVIGCEYCITVKSAWEVATGA